MSATIHVNRQGGPIRLRPEGAFDLAHAATLGDEMRAAADTCAGCKRAELDLEKLTHLDGTGAALLARLLDQVEEAGADISVRSDSNPEAARLILRYRGFAARAPVVPSGQPLLERVGATAAGWGKSTVGGLEFLGRAASAAAGVARAPKTLDWRAFPRLMQDIGADGLAVAGMANLLIGLIIAFLGVSQLKRIGAIAYVPQLVVVSQFRELGPLVTAIVIAGRSGAGLASEIATMKVSEEVDALRALGFDHVRWLVVPRCLALVLALPLLTLIGNALALLGGLAATILTTDMTVRAYLTATDNAISGVDLAGGLLKTPFLALVIGLVACGQGLVTRGGAAAVGSRTTNAVVMSIFGVILVSAFFTFFYALIGV
jgi:phospholipid/cholesterol/gamma-HCH transport system permease protein